ncbi:MAG: DNA polymerase III subunit delta [Myxococcota bacterium]
MAVRKSGSENTQVAWLCGEERLLIQDALERLRARAMAEIRAPDFNVQRASAKNTTVGTIVGFCRTLPVMSPKRLVEIHDADAIPAPDHEALLEYVHSPDPQCVLILVGEKVDKRLKLFKELESAGVLQVFDRLNERELPRWLENRARTHEITLQPEAANTLAAAVGSELMLLDSALEKLRLVVGKGGVVSEDHVAEHITTTKVETSFKIVDAMAAGKLGLALQTMLSVVNAGEAPLRLLGALAYAQRQSIRLLDKLEQGASPQEAAREVRIFYNADAAVRRVQAAGREALAAGMVAIADADRLLKGSSVSDEDVLVALLMRLNALQRRKKGAADAGASSAPRSAR